MLIDADGRVYSVGHNKQGACGTGDFNNVDTYTLAKTDITAKNIACGDCFSLIISIENDLYSCGHVDFHGHKTKEHLSKPKKL
jgi:alpha-tubulin suppressor-like RCC1 family protein